MKRSFTYFVSSESQPRVRRAADGVTVATGVLLAAWGMSNADDQSRVDDVVADLLTSQPSWLGSLMDIVFTLGLLYVLVLLGALIRGGRERRGALRDVLIAIAGSVLLGLVATLAVTGEWPYVLPEIGLDDPQPRFPILRVVVVVAALVSASPHLARPVRRLGWVTMVLTALAAVSLGYGTPSDAVGATGIGLVAAGMVLVVAGSPRGYPDPEAVADALEGMSLEVGDVRIDHTQTWGVRRLIATRPDGSQLAVKAYGRDASDSRRIAKAWRTLWYREGGRAVSYSRLQAVEHEALVTVMAGRTGALVSEVVAAGETSSEIALLVERGGLTPLADGGGDDVDDELMASVWRDVRRIHEASICHGSLTTAAILAGDTRYRIGDFSLGSLVASKSDVGVDVVELLYSSSLLVGVERAVAAALEGLGEERLVASFPYLQLPAVSRGTRRQAEDAKDTMQEIRAEVTRVTGTDLPEPVKLRRVSGRDVATAVLLLFALGALIPMLAGIDFAQVWSELQNARWGLIVVALVVGQSMFIPQAMGMMFSVGGQLPFWPLVTLQVAIMFIGLAVPSAAGRVAMNSAFLHKFGFGVTVSITQGAIDSLSGFLVEATILLLALISGDFDLGLDLDTQDVNWAVVLVVAIVLAVATVIAFRRIERLRERVLPELGKGWDALVDVLRDPSRALGLLGSNLATRLVWGTALWLILEALGTPLSFAGCLVAVVATNLLQGLVPVPGGIGVSETVMTGFLVALGIDQNSAFAATITWRIITFYLPSVEGYVATRWLERHEYL